MAAIILDGKAVSEEIMKELRAEIAVLRPVLAVILVGNNPASLVYVNQKRKACEKAGIDFTEINFPDTLSKEELIREIHRLNNDPKINGFIIQLPLPKHLEPALPQILKEINPYKDVDGFHAYNIGKMFLSTKFEYLPPATPLGIVKLLEAYQIDVAGREITIVGRSNNVGKPLSIMLLNRNATVTICHSQTHDVAYHTKKAEIVVIAVGKPKFLKAPMVRDESIVIDVGMHRMEDFFAPKGYRLVGDADFESLKEKAAYITPVPGGCGPMTVSALLINTVRATKRQKEGNIKFLF